jgi:hypothetical protein
MKVFGAVAAVFLSSVVGCAGNVEPTSDGSLEADATSKQALQCHTVGGTAHPDIRLAIDTTAWTMAVSGPSLGTPAEKVKLGQPYSRDGGYLHFDVQSKKHEYDFAFPSSKTKKSSGTFSIGVAIAEYDELLDGPRDYLIHYEFSCAWP